MSLSDPRVASLFRFIRHEYAAGEARLVYAFDDGPELVETIRFLDAPALAPEREVAFAHALQLLHLIA
ncbi:MAG TPA: endonuclease domain-containing protein, partial [Dokdonella sp.]|nr:endonuclease domain-containing protein [Dokdonella sp.]